MSTSTENLIGIRVDCDPTDNLPDSVEDFINGSLATMGNSWVPLIIDVPIQSLNAGALNGGWRYTRVGAPGLNDTDRRSTEAGQITYYAGSPAAVSIILEYEMEFKQLQIQRVPSGSVKETSPSQDGSKYAYHAGNQPSVQVDQKIPALLTTPNSMEISQGADPDFALYRFYDNFEGLFGERIKCDPATASFGLNSRLAGLTTLNTGLENAAGDAMFRNLAIRAGAGDWLQSYGLDATTPITQLLSKFTAGRYEDLLLL
jgi:hypothetical protein